jgi:hypothetical protein
MMLAQICYDVCIDIFISILGWLRRYIVLVK